MNILFQVIIFVLVGSGTLATARRSGASSRVVLTHVFLVATMAFLNTSCFPELLFLLKVFFRDGIHQSTQELHLAVSVLPPSATIFVWLLVSIMRFLFWIPVSLGLWHGVTSARRATVRLLPFVYVLDTTSLYFSLLPRIPSAVEVSLAHRLIPVALVHVFYLPVLLLYIWMFFFYRSKASDLLFGLQSIRDSDSRTANTVYSRSARDLNSGDSKSQSESALKQTRPELGPDGKRRFGVDRDE